MTINLHDVFYILGTLFVVLVCLYVKNNRGTRSKNWGDSIVMCAIYYVYIQIDSFILQMKTIYPNMYSKQNATKFNKTKKEMLAPIDRTVGRSSMYFHNKLCQ